MRCFVCSRESLVTVVPRQGSRVNPVSIGDARNLFQLRLLLEPACAAEATCSASPEMLQKLDTFRTLDPDVDFIAYNQAFHRAIADASGNRRMAAVTSDIIDQSERLVRVSIARMKGRDPTQLVAEHANLIDAIQHRNAPNRFTPPARPHRQGREARHVRPGAERRYPLSPGAERRHPLRRTTL